ncbi:hypothetical protein [Aureimonas glaciei]|jgi:hypothetical protein|uniref:Uncharacterized protein n=1 Tax=Aureimonas glaciei TaxID=1776957 RepID=A0A916XTF2_9HYPH|nr:hypothetical protein [Aureimonas glaciei]GGD06590.1 hypothetical protein GCM10011335_06980 [Aureimonas glaciei]
MLRSLILAAGVLAAIPASAVTVHNRDTETREVTFDKGTEETLHEIAVGASVRESCPTGCAVRVVGRGHDFMAEEGDVLAIAEMTIRRDPESASVAD